MTAGCDMQAVDCSVGSELVADVLTRFGTICLRVVGTSMLPAIRPHDVLEAVSCPAHGLQTGDVVLFARRGRLFAHRVIAVAGDGAVLTRGDTHGRPDPCIGAGEVLGKVVRITRGERRFEVAVPGRPTRWLAQLLRRSVAARWFFARWHAHSLKASQ